MRRLRVRLSVRALMLLVGVLAVTIEAEIMRRRWAFHRAEAAEFRHLEQGLMWLAKKDDAEAAEARRKVEEFQERAQGESFPDSRRNWLALADLNKQSASRHAREAEDNRLSSAEYGRLRRLHERAATHPWLQAGAVVGP